MSQAEIAGGAVTPPNELPSKGRILPDFALPAASSDRKVQFSDFRGANLVVIADDGQSETANLISEADRLHSEIKNQEAEVLRIVRSPLSTAVTGQESVRHLPCTVLVDEDGSIHRRLGAVDRQGRDSAAIYVTDRYGEVFAVYRKSAGQSIPDLAEILNWLEFINSQCPECEPPEWPI